MVVAPGQPHRPVARGVPNAFDRQPPQLYAFVTEIEEIPATDDNPAHWLVDMECLDGAWFDATWANLEDSHEDVRAFIDKVQGSRRLDEVYHKLDTKTRELLYRVHMHYQMLTVSKQGHEGKEAPVSLVQMHLEDGNPLRKNDINESTWYELNLGDPVELDRDAPHGAETDGTTVQAVLGLSVEDDSPLTEQPVLVFKEPDPQTQAVLRALYFPQYIDQEPMEGHGDGTQSSGKKRKFVHDGQLGQGQGHVNINFDDGGQRPMDLDGGNGGGGPPPPPGPPVNPMVYHPGTHQPFVGVMNIGTGHCIALFGRNGQIIAYTDFGHPMGFYYRTYPGYAAGAHDPYPCVCSNPVMILSHWDYDHYSMARWVPHAYQLRWIAPQQYMGPAAARELYVRVLNNAANGIAQACLHLWPAGVAGHLMTPCGFVERGNGPNPLAAGGRNDSGLVSYVRVQDDPTPGVAPPPANWPLVFNLPGVPLPPVMGPPLPVAVPDPAYLPPAGAFGLALPGGLPLITAHERYILLPGDVSFMHIPSQGVAAPPPVVGLVASHHGSRSWIIDANWHWHAQLAAVVAGAPAQAAMRRGALPGPPGGPLIAAAAMAAANLQIPLAPGQGMPPLMPAPANDPLAPALGGGRIAYSYGIRHPANLTHPYSHPRDEAILAYMLQGWTSRLNTPLDDWHSTQWHDPTVAVGVAGPGVAPPAPHRAGYVALGWQNDGAPGPGMTYLWQDDLPAGGGGPGANIVRDCVPACPRGGGGVGVYDFRF